jgi:hypothetical protein
MADVGIVGVGLVLGWSAARPQHGGSRLALVVVSLASLAVVLGLLVTTTGGAELAAFVVGVAAHIGLDLILKLRTRGEAA